MNLNKRFIIGIVAFIICVFILQLRVPREFSWEVTHRHDSTDPFGCMLFDSLMATSLKGGYTVEEKTFYQVAHDSTQNGRPRGVLMACDDWSSDSLTVCQILDLAAQGDVVMLSCNNFFDARKLRDTLGLVNVSSLYSNFSPKNIRYLMEKASSSLYDSISWVGHPEVFPRQTYHLYSSLITSYFYTYDESINMKCDTLAYRENTYRRYAEPEEVARLDTTALIDFVLYEDGTANYTTNEQELVAVAFNRGKGRVILVTMPLLFTNYTVLNDTVSGLTGRLMSEFGGLPVVRLAKYSNATIEEMRKESPLRFFVSQPPLRMALYTALTMLLLFMVFNSRRRQRVIPVIKRPANRSLEFTKLIGTLYYERHDNAGLLHTKYRGFVDEVRRRTGIDLDDDSDDEQLFELLAEKTGKATADLRELILRLRHLDTNGTKLSDAVMKQQINQMNELLTMI